MPDIKFCVKNTGTLNSLHITFLKNNSMNNTVKNRTCFNNEYFQYIGVKVGVNAYYTIIFIIVIVFIMLFNVESGNHL